MSVTAVIVHPCCLSLHGTQHTQTPLKTLHQTTRPSTSSHHVHCIVVYRIAMVKGTGTEIRHLMPHSPPPRPIPPSLYRTSFVLALFPCFFVHIVHVLSSAQAIPFPSQKQMQMSNVHTRYAIINNSPPARSHAPPVKLGKRRKYMVYTRLETIRRLGCYLAVFLTGHARV